MGLIGDFCCSMRVIGDHWDSVRIIGLSGLREEGGHWDLVDVIGVRGAHWGLSGGHLGSAGLSWSH